MTDDLIKRLRDWVPAEGPPEGRTAPDAVADMHEAVDRIEALKADKEQWQVYYNETVRDNFQLLCENVRLSAALAEQVEACFCPDCEMCFRHKQLLKETDETFTRPDNV